MRTLTQRLVLTAVALVAIVSVLIAPAIVTLSIGEGASDPIRYGIAGVAFAIVVAAVAYAKSKDLAIGGDNDPDAAVAKEPHPAQV